MMRVSGNGLFYHGSYVEVTSIDLSKCRKGLDFGRGFYVTSSKSQAVSFVPASVRKARRYGYLSEDFLEADGMISIYEFHYSPNLFIHCFEDADEEWLHFVACNRRKDLFPDLRRKYALVDVIGGKIADDQTAITLNNYVGGVYGEPGTTRADRIAIDLLETDRLKDQFCFRTDDAISALRFIRSERYGDIR